MTDRTRDARDHPVSLVLFDIDGTLLLTDGAGRSAFRHALERTFGTAGPLDDYPFHGKTDPQIVRELLSETGLEPEAIRMRLPSLWALYLERLERELVDRRRADRIRVLPGVRELLSALDGREGMVLGLLTGNLEPAARLKLAAAGLDTRFPIGGFGSDAAERAEIGRIALERARPFLGGDPEAARIVILGDTPADIACARAIGARALAVATGRHGPDELARAGADVVFDDLGRTAEVVRALLDGRESGGRRASAGSGG